jgi:SAM-dependent methyltransferase
MSDVAGLFDDVAGRYGSELAEGLRVTGEDPSYFARHRVHWLRRRLQELEVAPRRILEFGCGVGGSLPFLLDLPGVEEIVGVDVSAASLSRARSRCGDPRVRFVHPSELQDGERFDLAFSSGVFHHVAPAQRAAWCRYLRDRLRPGGVFALWENNPWNPGVRYVMSRVSFDRDAIPVPPTQARRLLHQAGFETTAPEFLFVFPRLFRILRGLELLFYRLPIGGQYLSLARRNSGQAAR